MLDRLGDEIARATTVVRFAPGSRFPAHVHKGGEEILVLDGVFQDETGDFPAGSYIRNPPESRHTPASAAGCTLFVKLWQFDLADRTHVCIDTNKMPFLAAPVRAGIEVMPLFRDGREDVRIERWPEGSHHSHRCGGRHGNFRAGWLLFRGRGNLRADVVATAAENGANRSQDFRSRRPRLGQARTPGSDAAAARTFLIPAQLLVDGSESKLVIAVHFQRMPMTNNRTLFSIGASL